MSNKLSIGVFDTAPIIVKHQFLSATRGRPSPARAGAKEAVAFSIYEKNGKHFPVNLVIKEAVDTLNETKLANNQVNLQGAKKVADVSMGAFDELWDSNDDAALERPSEAAVKLKPMIDAIVDMPVEQCSALGIKRFNALGQPVNPSPKQAFSANMRPQESVRSGPAMKLEGWI